MRKSILATAVLTATAVVVLFACNSETKSDTPAKPVAITQDSLVKRGDYLVNAMGCDDCHSPKKMGAHGPEIDMDRRLSGHPDTEPTGKVTKAVMQDGWVLFGMGLTKAVGPWGATYAANLTSDSTGIGMWTEAQFMKAIRQGISKGLDGNRPILPPMPWTSYKNLSDDDLRSIFAYLKTTKPVKNVVPQPTPLDKL